MADSAFEAWYGEVEGFALRAERLTGPKDELQAAFEAGVEAERERCAKIAETDADWSAFQRRPKPDHMGQETNAFAPRDDDGTYPTAANVFAYTTGIATGRAIAAAIRNPPEQPA